MPDPAELLQFYRMRRGFSQRALAKAAKVSNGTISLIERGKLDPTIGQLKKLLAALDVSMAQFFATEENKTARYFFSTNELVEIGKGAISYRQIAGAASDRNLQILDETYLPGADTGATMIVHEGEEGGIVLDGEIEVQVLDQRRTLRAGDCYQFPSKLPHRFRNKGKKPCRLISACTPPTF